jgi:aldose 1-epimerase
MARLDWRGREVLAPLPAGADPNAAPAGAFVMLPWANRLDAGRIRIDGREHRLPVNRPQDQTAIHGLARDRPWAVEAASAESAVLTQVLEDPALPFRYAARLEVALGEAGMALTLSVTARGTGPQPIGLGWHPWFARPPGTRLGFRAAWRCRHDARLLPVAAEPFPGLDGEEGAYLGLDTHFAGWDGEARLRHADGTTFRLHASGAWAANLQVYAPPALPVLCVEPMSHVPDAPNRPALAALGPMQVLRPGETLEGHLLIGATPGA